MDPNSFRRLSSHWATGVSILTTLNKAGRHFGLTMNALSSLSLRPPLFLVCIDKASDTIKPLAESQVFCVNILKQDQKALAQAFAIKGKDKFTGVKITAGRTGAPVLAGALAIIECRVRQTIDGGDHLVFFGEIEHSSIGAGEPLVFYKGDYRALKSSK